MTLSLPHVFRRGHAEECGALVPAIDQPNVKAWSCTCPRPYLSEPAEGFEWVAGHVQRCRAAQLRAKSEKCLGPALCGHSTLTVVPLPDGLLGRVRGGELWRRVDDMWSHVGEPDPAECPEDAPWREAWEHLRVTTATAAVRDPVLRCDEVGVKEAIARGDHRPKDGLVCLVGPGITRAGKHADLIACEHDFGPGCPDPGAHANPHNLKAPELRRLEAEQNWRTIDGHILRDAEGHFEYTDDVALLISPRPDVCETGDLSGCGVVERELLDGNL